MLGERTRVTGVGFRVLEPGAGVDARAIDAAVGASNLRPEGPTEEEGSRPPNFAFAAGVCFDITDRVVEDEAAREEERGVFARGRPTSLKLRGAEGFGSSPS